MKKIFLIMACLLSLEASAQQKQPQLSETELKNVQTQIRMAVDNLIGYIVRLGNSENAGGASPQEKVKILKYVKRTFYEFPYRYVTVSNRSGRKRIKADTYFYNLAREGSKTDGYLRIYKIDPEEYYLSQKVLNNPKNFKFIAARNGIRQYKISIPVTQLYIKTSLHYSENSKTTVIDKDKKIFDIFVLLDEDSEVLCKLGNIRIEITTNL